MTTLTEVLNQVDTVLDDQEYPPTRAELEVLYKVLITISRNGRFMGGVHSPAPASRSRNDGALRNTISTYMRLIEKHQRTPGMTVACRI